MNQPDALGKISAAPSTPSGGLGLPRLGRYQARKILGSGGSGTVYSAIDTASGDKVALKVLRHGDHLEAETRERFLREAQLAASVKSPYVVEYRDAGSEGDELYLISELLAGGDAHRLCQRYPQGMPEIMAAAIGRDCARGLAAIHDAGLIHRDVKPSNIFLGSTGISKLGDLGLARSLDMPGELAVQGNLVGTPDFMAPEQSMAGEDLDHRADIYALAASLFFLVTNRPPHVGTTAWAVLAQLINDPFPNPRSVRADLSPALARVICKAGAKDPTQRYQDARSLAEDLDAVIAGREPKASEDVVVRAGTTRLAKPTAVKPKIVLLVDDDPIIRRIYRTRFEMDGFIVATAADGREALTKAAISKPDVVLLDFMLPGDDGLAVLHKLRTLPGLEHLPAVVFSSTFNDERDAAARQLGVAQLLTKAHCTPREISTKLIELTVRQGEAAAPRPQTVKTSKDDQAPTGLIRLAEITLLRLQLLLGRLGRDAGIDADLAVLAELAATAYGLASAAGTVKAIRVAMLAEATEHLARQLLEQPDRLSASCLRTIGQALTGLRRLLPRLMEHEPAPSLHAVVVDDEPIALEFSCRALGKADIATMRFQDPIAALAHMAGSQADLVVSDVLMAGLNGIQFATELRALPEHRATPIIFVTSLTDFASRLANIQDPRMDVIAKPILLGELAVKALAMVLTPEP